MLFYNVLLNLPYFVYPRFQQWKREVLRQFENECNNMERVAHLMLPLVYLHNIKFTLCFLTPLSVFYWSELFDRFNFGVTSCLRFVGISHPFPRTQRRKAVRPEKLKWRLTTNKNEEQFDDTQGLEYCSKYINSSCAFRRTFCRPTYVWLRETKNMVKGKRKNCQNWT